MIEHIEEIRGKADLQMFLDAEIFEYRTVHGESARAQNTSPRAWVVEISCGSIITPNRSITKRHVLNANLARIGARAVLAERANSPLRYICRNQVCERRHATLDVGSLG